MPNTVNAATLFVAKRSPWLRKKMRVTARAARTARQRLAARGAIEPQTATFSAFLGLSYSGSPRAIYEHLLGDARFAGWRFTWAFVDPVAAVNQFPSLRDPRTTVVKFRSGDFHRAAARSAWQVNNSMPLDYIPTRLGQALVQTWHGTPFKRLGADVIDATTNATNSKVEIDDRYRRAGEQASYILSSSEFTSEKFASAFLLSSAEAAAKIAEVGNPRNDVLVRLPIEVRDRTRAKLGVGADRKAILYTPTWRDDSHSSRTGYTHTLGADLDVLRNELGEDHVLLFRAHYLIAHALDFARWGDFVVDVSSYPDINDLYLASDLLVTDYSSTMFDYAITDKPMAFLMHDLEHYRGTVRGLYFDPSVLPGPVVTDTADLVAAIRGSDARAEEERVQRAQFRAEYCTWDDGGASARVAEMMLRGYPQ